MTDSRDKTRYTGPDAIAAESVYDAGYEDCEKALKPIIAELESQLAEAREEAKQLRGTLGAIIKQLDEMQSKEYSHKIFEILTTSYSDEKIKELLTPPTTEE